MRIVKNLFPTSCFCSNLMISGGRNTLLDITGYWAEDSCEFVDCKLFLVLILDLLENM